VFWPREHRATVLAKARNNDQQKVNFYDN